MALPPLPPLPPLPLPALYMQQFGRIKRQTSTAVILDHDPLHTAAGSYPLKERQPRVLAAEDIPGYHEFRGWIKAHQQLDAEGVLMSYPVGHARINACEARRLANERAPSAGIGRTAPMLPLPLPPLPRLPLP